MFGLPHIFPTNSFAEDNFIYLEKPKCLLRGELIFMKDFLQLNHLTVHQTAYLKGWAHASCFCEQNILMVGDLV